MKQIALGTGLAPDVAIVDGLVYVAYGVTVPALVLFVLTLDGVEVRRQPFSEGFFNSFPRFGGRWLAYKRNHDWRAAALNLVNGESRVFEGTADGNYGLAVNDALGLVAYQNGAGYPIRFGSLFSGSSRPTLLSGAPDGLDTFVSDTEVTLRKDTRQSVPGMFYPVRAGDLTVGELPDLALNTPPRGAAVLLDGDDVRAVFAHQDAPTPRCASDGTVYAIVSGGPAGVRLWLGTAADLRSLPLASSIQPTPQPPPPIHIPPSPPKPEPPVSIPNQIDLVKSIRAKYPRTAPGSSPLGEDAWRCIVEIAQRTGTWVFRKDGGERCFIPAGLLLKYPNGVSINRTIIGRGAAGTQWIKVLGDGEGTAFPIWNVGDTPADGEYVDVSGIVLNPQQPPTQPPPTQPPPSSDLAARVAVLEQKYDRIINALHGV